MTELHKNESWLVSGNAAFMSMAAPSPFRGSRRDNKGLVGSHHRLINLQGELTARRAHALLRAAISGGHHEDEPECVASRGYHLIHLNDSGAMTLCRRLLPGAGLS